MVSTVFTGMQEFLLCEDWPCTRLGSELVEDEYQMYSVVGEKQRAHSQSVPRLVEGTLGFAASPWQNTSVQKETEMPFLATVLNLPSCEFLLPLSITPCSREPDYRKDLLLTRKGSLFGVSQGAASHMYVMQCPA